MAVRKRNRNSTVTITLTVSECTRLFFLLNNLRILRQRHPHLVRIAQREVTTLRNSILMLHPAATNQEYEL